MLTNRVNKKLKVRSFAIKKQAYKGENPTIPISPLNHFNSIAVEEICDSAAMKRRGEKLIEAADSYWRFD